MYWCNIFYIQRIVCSRIAAATATGRGAFNTQTAADGDDTKAPAAVPPAQGAANSGAGETEEAA